MPNFRDAHVLVTGATGFIGAHLTQRLLAEGARVSAFRRAHSTPLQELPTLRDVETVDWHEADLRTYGAVSRVVRAIRPDIVFHLASAGGTDPFLPTDTAIRNNVDGTIHLLRALEGRAHVIVARTPGERDAMNVYAASKAAAWAFCQMYQRTQGWPIVGVMPFHTYGPGQSAKALIPSAIASALRGDNFPMTHGAQLRDWTYVDDVVDAFIRVAGWRLSSTPPNGDTRGASQRFGDDTIEIGTGRATSVREVVECVFQIAGGSGKPLVGTLPARPGEAQRQVADADRTEHLIGWRAQVSLETGLRETIKWTREWLCQTAS